MTWFPSVRASGNTSSGGKLSLICQASRSSSSPEIRMEKWHKYGKCSIAIASVSLAEVGRSPYLLVFSRSDVIIYHRFMHPVLYLRKPHWKRKNPPPSSRPEFLKAHWTGLPRKTDLSKNSNIFLLWCL